MLKIKSILFVAGTGFIFSFLSGLFSGNPVTVILFRSIISSVFFTVIVTASVFVIKKAIPELDSLFQNSGEDTADSSPGGNVDIVIEDESPYTPVAADEDTHVSAEEEKLLQKDFIEEVEEESIDDISVLDQAEDSDEVVEVMDDSMDSNALPELDGNVSFVSGSNESSIEGDNDAINKLGGNTDPGTMAKAIKTILKKDQKG